MRPTLYVSSSLDKTILTDVWFQQLARALSAKLPSMRARRRLPETRLISTVFPLESNPTHTRTLDLNRISLSNARVKETVVTQEDGLGGSFH